SSATSCAAHKTVPHLRRLSFWEQLSHRWRGGLNNFAPCGAWVMQPRAALARQRSDRGGQGLAENSLTLCLRNKHPRDASTCPCIARLSSGDAQHDRLNREFMVPWP